VGILRTPPHSNAPPRSSRGGSPTATAADFEALRDARTTQRKAYLDTLTTLRIEIAALLTTEEWRHLESARGRVRDSLLGS